MSTNVADTMRIAFTPPRKAEVIALARAAREKYAGMEIDDVAATENIILIREPDASSKKAGFAYSLKSRSPKLIPSLARPDTYMFSFCETEITFYDCIVINPLYGISEREIFWHEFYHLWYSPSRKASLDFFHQYSTGGVLDAQEERRANIFAAYMLVPEIEEEDTVPSLRERWNISEGIAKTRMEAMQYI